MTDNLQAAHEAAMKEGRRFTTDHAQCSAYHEHMISHLRPAIEAAHARQRCGMARKVTP